MKTLPAFSVHRAAHNPSAPAWPNPCAARQRPRRIWPACCALILAAASLALAPVARAAATGVVFVNANSSPDNQVWMYSRASNGQLTFVGAFDTQGNGGPEIGSQGALALSANNKYLYAVNEGSNEVTAFRVSATGLTFVSKIDSGGVCPNSIAIFGNLIYILNAEGATGNIAGFTMQKNGSMVAIAESNLPLTYAVPKAVQISFTPDGTTLIVAEQHANNFDLYAVGAGGIPTGPTAVPSAATGPFGFAFDSLGHLIVSDIIPSGGSSYTVSDGTLETISAYVKDGGKGACWVANTNNPAFPQQYSYITNTNSDTVSSYTVAGDGTITLLNGKSAILPTGAFPLDMVTGKNSKYLYVLEGLLPGIAGFQINSDGSLKQIQDLRGTPTTSWGLAGY